MEDKKHSFMDQLNLFFIGAVIGVIVGACFGINAVKGSNNRAEKKVKAYEEYYKCTETLLDSLDGTHNLDLMDTDLETDYGADYLEAKSKVDELIVKQIVACATYIYHNKENGVNIVLMVSIVNQLKNIRVELHQP